MKVNYHFHSGVSVEADGSLFIFDYYKKGPDDSIFGNFEFVYVFASHGHRDHFDKKILEWEEIHDNVRYVFSYDIPVQSGTATVVRPGESIRVGSVGVSALKSTDEGVAFVV
ncbi:MAG: MBL fold metallo-hydrolase, partial [Clostridia bacterium]|nr:MBL fold metallo-hydrolase [Clostridia bacterium]